MIGADSGPLIQSLLGFGEKLRRSSLLGIGGGGFGTQVGSGIGVGTSNDTRVGTPPVAVGGSSVSTLATELQDAIKTAKIDTNNSNFAFFTFPPRISYSHIVPISSNFKTNELVLGEKEKSVFSRTKSIQNRVQNISYILYNHSSHKLIWCET